MVHAPKRSSVFGNRKTGDLTDRESSRKAVGNQNLSPGRYDVNEEAKKATQKSLSKSNEMKLNKADTGGTGTPVEINPEKSIVGQTFN
jgi:hypothetical protein